ncbi:glycosyltransferase [Methylotenera mobilis]|uniref:glycosyltransferase n=1 Tax=Methylotenera mobilis TaxID=359408 RepID=UPI00037F1A9C|nr:glycosyltransferase [Methylotenera mobilis]
MKILLISYFFPPYNNIGAVRTGKLAEYWLSKGYDVRVISANDQPFSPSLVTTFPVSRTIYTKWVNVNALPEVVLGGRAKVSKQGFSSGSSILNRLGRLYKTLLNFPDGQIGWYPLAVKAGGELIRGGWAPDLIYASAHPLTSLLVAKELAAKFNVPWVAEFRDLWTDNPYYQFPEWRKRFERKIETRVLKTASAVVTVSDHLAEILRIKTGLPVASILNGFDQENIFDSTNSIFSKNKLNIVYTGMIYSGKRDPSPLFLALKLLKNSDRVHIHFYGRYLSDLKEMIVKCNVESMVSISDPVSYQQSLQIQVESDILLLLLWNHESERGVYTGKLFEYFGARHPILSIGAENGVAAELIKERKAGMVSNDPEVIANQLEKWIELKINGKKDALILPKEASDGLTRKEQFSRLDSFLIHNNLLSA